MEYGQDWSLGHPGVFEFDHYPQHAHEVWAGLIT